MSKSNDGYPVLPAEVPSSPPSELTMVVRQVEESLAQQIGEVRSTLEHHLEVAARQLTAQKQALEVSNAKLRVVEQRTIRHSNEIKFVNRVVEKHGLAEDLAPLRQQLVDLERREEKNSETFREMQETLCSEVARIEAEMKTLHDGENDTTRLEMLSISAQLQHVKSEHVHFTCWARPLLEEFLPLPAEVKDFQNAMDALTTRQNRCEDDVNKIQRLGRILDDKVEVFDDLQRRMEELNANARRVLGSQFATSVRCLCCKEEDSTALVARQRSASPVGREGVSISKVVNEQFEATPPSATTRRARPQSARARLEHKREEKAKEKQQMVFTVPRVRADFPNPKQPVVGIRGISIFKQQPHAPMAAQTRKRPQKIGRAHV